MLTTLAHKAGHAAISTGGIRGPALIVAMLAVYLIYAGLPVSLWLDVRSVHVSDTVSGQQPVMVVDRTIKRNFDAVWRVELEREFSEGRFGIVEIARGDSSYNPDAQLPEPLTMDWWTYPKEFRLLPGRYRIETCWRIAMDIIADRRKCIMSNVFEVR